LHNHEGFHFCPRCASPLIEKVVMGEKRPACPSCGWVHYEDPKRAAGVLILRGREVLLVRRTLDPYLGHWSIPAGFVNAFEDPAAAALRECREETGMTAELARLFAIHTGRETSGGPAICHVSRPRVSADCLQSPTTV